MVQQVTVKDKSGKPIEWYAGKQYDDDIANAKKVLSELDTYYPGATKYEIAGFFFWQGDYARSLQVAKQITEQFPGTWSGVDALRIAADDCFWTADYKSSVDYYRRYLDKVRGGVVHDAARRSYAYALESDRQYKAAADVFESLVGKFDRESSAEFLAGGARCYRGLGQVDE